MQIKLLVVVVVDKCGWVGFEDHSAKAPNDGQRVKQVFG